MCFRVNPTGLFSLAMGLEGVPLLSLMEIMNGETHSATSSKEIAPFFCPLDPFIFQVSQSLIQVFHGPLTVIVVVFWTMMTTVIIFQPDWPQMGPPLTCYIIEKLGYSKKKISWKNSSGFSSEEGNGCLRERERMETHCLVSFVFWNPIPCTFMLHLLS